MTNDTFFNELGTEPFGYVGQDSEENINIVTSKAKHNLFGSRVTLIPLISGRKFSTIHKVFSSTVDLVNKIGVGESNAIHQVIVPLITGKLIFKPTNAIHKVFFYDKWNAKFSFDCARYLTTPFAGRLLETPGCDYCSDPSLIACTDSPNCTNTTDEISRSDHNSLTGLQGGVFEEYYHLTLAERNKLATMSQGSTTYVSRFQPATTIMGDAWVNPESQVLEMFYNTKFNGVSVEHSSKADEVDGGYF